MIHKCSITYIDCYKLAHLHLCTHMNMHAGIHLFMHTCNLHILSKNDPSSCIGTSYIWVHYYL